MRIQVAVGVITDELNQVLITRRSFDQPHGGLWEFPGGKLQPNETPQAALSREIQEELGINIISADYLGTIQHDYEIISVELLIFHIHQYVGNPVCRESQLDLQWVAFDDLKQYAFPEANQAIINLLNYSVLHQATI